MAKITVQAADGTRRSLPLAGDVVTIGRSRESDIYLLDPWLSRHHAEIHRKADGFYLVDLGSKNGTMYNGRKIKEEHLLSNNDIITLGEHVLTFLVEGLPEVEPDMVPAGTQIFPARRLSEIATRPAVGASEIARQNRVLGVLSRAASALVVHRPLPETFELILDLLFEAVAAERGAILLLEGALAQPVVKAARSRYGRSIESIPRSIARRVVHERAALLLPNVMQDVALKASDSIALANTQSAICAPLWLPPATPGGPDQVIGLVYLDTSRLGAPFLEEDLQILTTISNVAAAKIENAQLIEERIEKRRLEEDLRMAAEVQSSLLPHVVPELRGYDLTGSNRPCRAIGGDYYDFALSEGQLLLALGDVSGKGSSAALLMSVLRSAVHAHWQNAGLAEAVREINRTFCQNAMEGKFATFFLGRLHPDTGRLTYVNAGHNPPLVVRAGGAVERLAERGLVLGVREGAVYTEACVGLEWRDTLLVFSDGVTETWSASGAEFGDTGLADVVRRHQHLRVKAIEAQILNALDGFSSGAKATDDRTIILLRRLAP